MPRKADIAARLPFRLGLSAEEAAVCVGMCPSFFRQCVKRKIMPAPRMIGSWRVWLADELNAALHSLPVGGEGEEVDTWRDVVA